MTDQTILDEGGLFDRLRATIIAMQVEGYEPVEIKLNHADWLEACAAFDHAASHLVQAAIRDRMQTICGLTFTVTEAGGEGYLGETQIAGTRTRAGAGWEKWFPVICQKRPEGP